MGKGVYRVLNIPEDEAVLLNSREKAPYLICVEVLKCETPRYSFLQFFWIVFHIIIYLAIYKFFQFCQGYIKLTKAVEGRNSISKWRCTIAKAPSMGLSTGDCTRVLP